MYRHSAESIRETDNKMFVSLDEKTKYNNYENTLRKKEDSYSKTEVDNKIKELSDSTYGNVESTYVSESNTIDGYIKDLEILGNTVQNTEDLSDIKSVGELQEDNTYKMSIVSCGKNLFDKTKTVVGYVDTNGTFISGGGSIISDYIKVKPNINYINNKNLEKVIFYDKDKKFIELILGNNFPQIPDGCVYARVQYGNESTTTDTLQIEEGTISTPYEPYQESRVDINLPCQLEKVGDISDRLYYDEEEKLWCIEKNITQFYVDYNYTPNTVAEYIGNTECVFVQYSNYDTILKSNSIYLISNKFKNNGKSFANGNYSTTEPFSACVTYTASKLRFLIPKSALTDISVSSVKKFFEENKTVIYAILNTPQKIILPLDVQLQLNSYANKTHIYMVSGEVEPTIKATLPKSLGASVQSLNEKTDIISNRLKVVEELKEGQNLNHESNKGYVICENTNNGQIDNLNIEGKTLVNLVDLSSISSSGSLTTVDSTYFTLTQENVAEEVFYKVIRPLTAGNVYTVIYTVLENTVVGDNLVLKGGAPLNVVSINKSINKSVGRHAVSFIANSSGTGTYVRFAISKEEQDGVYTKIDKNIIILEGDHTENSPSYFEGLMSVGGDNEEINIITNNENLLAKDFVLGALEPNGSVSSSTYRRVSDFIFTPKQNCNIYFNYNQKYNLVWWINEYDKNKINICQTVSKSPILNSETEYIRVGFRKNDSTPFTETELKDLNVAVSYYNTDYIPHKSHTKSLLYYNDLGELVPVPELHEWDSIEKHSDGKYYYHKRSEKVVLNGSENWYLNNESVTESNTLAFYIPTNPKAKNLLGIICDLFHTDINIFKMDYECIRISSDQSASIYIRINKSRLSSENVEGFKTWLSSNNVTVVYELAEEQVYECVNLNLDTYDNETMVMVNSGAISPKLSFNVSSHIGNTVSILRERLKAVEESFTQYKLNKDRLLLNARYKSDKGSFNMSIISLSSNVEEIDYELFELTKSVIESSLDKIDVIDMENLIDFYTIIGKFDYYMADILFEILDSQINPVIEIPEEEVEVLL